jgi:enolase
MGEIIDLIAREVIDSRGNPTIEVEVLLDSGTIGRAFVPSGASTGKKEALELRDGGKRFHGKGVQKAVKNVLDKIAPRLIGLSSENQISIYNLLIELDGTENKATWEQMRSLGFHWLYEATQRDRNTLYRYMGGCNVKVLPCQ